MLMSQQAFNPQSSYFTSILLGALLAFGTFTRITFIAIAWPFILLHLYNVSSRQRQRFSHLLIIGIASITTSIAIIAFDTWWFASPHQWVVTPVNFLLYNIRTENTDIHGSHPRWLHGVVNAPLMFSVAWLVAVSQVPLSWEDPRSAQSEG